MSTRPLKEPLAGEHILQVEPRMAPFVEAGWQRRSNLYTGRALSAEALSLEQQERSGHLALRGQVVAPGIVSGLEVRVAWRPEPGGNVDVPWFQVQPGLGLAATGEDVRIERAARVRTTQVHTWWEPDSRPTPPFDLGALLASNPSTTQQNLQVAILLLVPVESMRVPRPPAGVEVDEADYAFEDQQRVDGGVLVLYAWPRYWPMPHQDARWRSRLAHMIFDHERQRGWGEHAPWEEAGIPLALVGFKTENGQLVPAFVDRQAVARPGGAPRGRSLWVPGQGNPLLWQARLQHFTEHLASLQAEGTTGSVVDSLAYLPPVGVLPKDAVDVFEWSKRFFPPRFRLDAVPVPLEQLDAVTVASASLMPLDVEKDEQVRVLVPVPASHFDPRLLRTEFLDPAFLRAISSSLQRLGEWLRRRQDVRGKTSLLQDALDGYTPDRHPALDPAAVRGEYTGTTPLDPTRYGAEEAGFGTDGGYIPTVQRTLEQWWLEGTWTEPQRLSQQPAYQLYAVASPKGGQMAIFARESSHPGYLFRQYDGAWQAPEQLHEQGNIAPFWAGSNYGYVAVVNTTDTGGPHAPPAESIVANHAGSYNAFYLKVAVRQGTGWTQVDSAVIPEMASMVFAVPWGEDKVDFFVTTYHPNTGTTGLYRLTWMNGALSSSVQKLASWNEPISNVLLAHRGGGRIDLLIEYYFAGQFRSRHLSGVHTDGGAAMDVDLNVPTVTDWQGTARPLSLVSASPNRLEAILHVFQDNSIRHGWYDSKWNLSTEQLATNITECRLMSPRPGWLDLVWMDSQGNLQHREWLGSRWRPARNVLTQPSSTYFRSFATVQRGTGALDVTLGTADGVLHVAQRRDDAGHLIEQRGVKGLIEYIAQRQQSTQAFIQSHFLRTQAETQRLRQLMISGSMEASRLAISPVLGLALGQNAVAARSDIENYLTRVRGREQREGLALSDAIEAYQAAASMKQDIAERLVELVQELGLDTRGWMVRGVTLVEQKEDGPHAVLLRRNGNVLTKKIARENVPLAEFLGTVQRRTDLYARIEEEHAALERTLSGLTQDQQSLRWSESDYFSEAVLLLEHVNQLLRDMDMRMVTFGRLSEAYKRLQGQLEGLVAQANQRLQAIGIEVKEARQDVTVAWALLAEEKQRIERINQQRRQVVEEHTPYLVFVRPRERDLTRDTPARALDSGWQEDVLPEVLASTAAAPPELWSFVELLRDSPLEWLTAGPGLLKRLDRIELVQKTVGKAQERAVQRTPPKLPIAANNAASKAAEGLTRLFQAREDVVSRARSRTAAVETVQMQGRSWQELQRSTPELLTLGDLMEGAHGRSDVGREASALLEKVSKVATGLYQRFGEVLPVVRLVWVEEMSQYDEAVDLRNLARLPRWDEVEPDERREMQRLVDWLFLQVDVKKPDALSLMNDLVRACMLLASHAPVNELVSGHMPKPAVARVGGTVEVTVDPVKVRIGMHVLLSAGEHTVQAVVEDLGTGAAMARVVQASAPTVNLPAKTAAHFSEPQRGRGALLPQVGAQRSPKGVAVLRKLNDDMD